MLIFYKTIIQPVLEYACPVWHTGLTKQDSDLLEQIQRRAMTVLYPTKSYTAALKEAKLETLSLRRDIICKKFFTKMCKQDHKLNYLLEKREMPPYDLRHPQPFNIMIPHTERYKRSLLMHGLLNYC